uniref:uncharacterized protein LOC118518013 isoform X2 n=1 Tax=Halichoerus grypus TaxID=9711 RepID=UPI001659D6AF|nr:uncharacterized protein LOC118518013 isoform X2 [Halichoerus grypus]
MTWVSELRFLVCTGKITALYEVVVRLPGGDVGFDKGKPVLGSSCCTREPWGAPDHTSRTPQKSLRICQESNFHKGQEFSPVLFTAVFPVPRTAPQRDEEKFQRLGSTRSRPWQIGSLLKIHFLDGWSFCRVFLHRMEGAAELSGVFLIKALIPFNRAPPHDLITFQRPHLLIPSPWGLEFPHMNLWGT